MSTSAIDELTNQIFIARFQHDNNPPYLVAGIPSQGSYEQEQGMPGHVSRETDSRNQVKSWKLPKTTLDRQER